MRWQWQSMTADAGTSTGIDRRRIGLGVTTPDATRQSGISMRERKLQREQVLPHRAALGEGTLDRNPIGPMRPRTAS